MLRISLAMFDCLLFRYVLKDYLSALMFIFSMIKGMFSSCKLCEKCEKISRWEACMVVSVNFFMQTWPKFCYVYYLRSYNKLRTIEPHPNIYIGVILFNYIFKKCWNVMVYHVFFLDFMYLCIYICRILIHITIFV